MNETFICFSSLTSGTKCLFVFIIVRSQTVWLIFSQASLLYTLDLWYVICRGPLFFSVRFSNLIF